MPIMLGLVIGILLGVAYLFSKEPTVRRTLASSVLLGIVVGILVELARRPIFTAIFAGLSVIFVSQFVQWVLSSRRNQR